MTPTEFSALLDSVMKTPAPMAHAPEKIKQPVATKVANAIIAAGVSSRDSLSEYVNEMLSVSPERVRWISDLHFFHKNIIIHCERPFADKEEMTKHMISKWMETVSSDDLVLILGDITMGGVSATNAILNSLPGEKILVLGNHDISKDDKVLNLDVDGKTDCLVLDYAGCKLLVSHCPIPANRLPSGCVSVHGHIHTYAADERGFNASVEWLDYTPMRTPDFLHPDVVLKSSKKKSYRP